MRLPNTATDRDRTAIALSIAVHLCAFAALIAFVHPELVGPAEDFTSVPISPITIVARRHEPSPAAGPTAPPPVPRKPSAAHMTPAVTERPHRVRMANPATAPTAAPHVEATAVAAEAVIRRPPDPQETAAPAVIPAAAATPGPAPAAAPTPVTAAAAYVGFFSKDYPPLPKPPAALQAIRARLGGRFVISVNVDESGRATSVSFLTPLADPSIADDIRARLMALTYVPAECNGLPCDGTLEIRNDR